MFFMRSNAVSNAAPCNPAHRKLVTAWSTHFSLQYAPNHTPQRLYASNLLQNLIGASTFVVYRVCKLVHVCFLCCVTTTTKCLFLLHGK